MEGYDKAVDALQSWCAEKASYHIIQDPRPESRDTAR